MNVTEALSLLYQAALNVVNGHKTTAAERKLITRAMAKMRPRLAKMQSRLALARQRRAALPPALSTNRPACLR